MYNYNQVLKGITNYLDNEIISKMSGWQKWVYGAGIGIVLSKSTNMFNKVKDNSLVKTLEIIDENDNINIDELYQHLKKEAEKGAITFDVKGMGMLTLTSNDVDKLYEYIRASV